MSYLGKVERELPLFKGCSELVRAGCRLHAAAYAFESRDDVVGFHALYESGDAGSVSGATANECAVLYYIVVVDVNDDLARTGAKSVVNELSHIVF